MGFFLLVKKGYQGFQDNKLKDFLKKKGFKRISKFTLSRYDLILANKTLIKGKNYLNTKLGSVFAIGTPIYKKKDFSEGLKVLLDDFLEDNIDYLEFLGSFCIILYNFQNQEIKLIIDSSSLCHLFSYKNGLILSSSQLAILESIDKSFTVMESELIEQVAIGYIIPPNTLFSEIKLINPLIKGYHKIGDIQIVKAVTKHREKIKPRNRRECVNYIIDLLDEYFLNISKFSFTKGVSIGMSGGHDSRLMLAMAKRHKFPMLLFSHKSEVHGKEFSVAEALAEELNLELKFRRFTTPKKMNTNELWENIIDSIFYYDGRTNQSMGSYNAVHTRHYKEELFAQLYKFELNGLGGEYLRNIDFVVNRKRARFVDFFNTYVLKVKTEFWKNKSSFQKSMDFICEKISPLIDIDKNLFYSQKENIAIDFFWNIWGPYARGLRNHVDNQVIYFLTPLAENFLKIPLLNMIKFFGDNDELENAIICKLDKKLGDIASSYGYNFCNKALKYRLKDKLRRMMPLKVARFYLNVRHRDDSDYSNQMIERHKFVKDSFHYLKKLLPSYNWEAVKMDREVFERAIFLGTFLLEYRNKLRLERLR